jgi:ureidoglycolate hydrolase
MSARAIGLFWVVICWPAAAADGAWVAFYREGNQSVAFERASISDKSVNLLRVSPKKSTGDLVYAWEIVTQVHEFDCASRTYRLLTKKIFDEFGRMTADETSIVKAMNDAFKNRRHPLDTDALKKAHTLVCAKAEPAPAKPFVNMLEALSWMAN